MHLNTWSNHAPFADKAQELVATHNEEFNPKGLRAGNPEASALDAAPVEEPAAKRARLPESDIATVEDLTKKFVNLHPT